MWHHFWDLAYINVTKTGYALQDLTPGTPGTAHFTFQAVDLTPDGLDYQERGEICKLTEITYFLPSAEILLLSLLSIRPWLWLLISWFKEAGSLPLASFLHTRTQLEYTTIVLGPQVWRKWGVILQEGAVLSLTQAYTATCWPPAVTVQSKWVWPWRISKFPSPRFKPTPHGHS